MQEGLPQQHTMFGRAVGMLGDCCVEASGEDSGATVAMAIDDLNSGRSYCDVRHSYLSLVLLEVREL